MHHTYRFAKTKVLLISAVHNVYFVHVKSIVILTVKASASAYPPPSRMTGPQGSFVLTVSQSSNALTRLALSVNKKTS